MSHLLAQISVGVACPNTAPTGDSGLVGLVEVFGDRPGRLQPGYVSNRRSRSAWWAFAELSRSA